MRTGTAVQVREGNFAQFGWENWACMTRSDKA